MANTIYINLVEQQHYYNQYGHTGTVVINQEYSLEDVVDEMISEGLNIDKQTVLSLIEKFNTKTTNLVLSGNIVETGLLTMRPIVKGPYNDEKYQPDVLVLQGMELREAISETKVDILNKSEFEDKQCNINLNNEESENTVKNGYLGVSQDYPACGHAFRAWLFRS